MMMNGQKYPMTLAEGVKQSYPTPPRYIQETDPIPGGIEQFRAMNAFRGTPNPAMTRDQGFRAFGVTQY
jgi:hypothetical protein